MDTANKSLTDRARAYAETAAAYAKDPCDAIYREQARQDSERVHRWIAANPQEMVL